jgi:hypothetical protein
MKNRRLNVLFIAIIALAAAPQAFNDAYRLVNAAQERAETEFWSVFLSYQMPEADGAKTSGRTELVAARRQQQETEACQLEGVVARSTESLRRRQSNQASPGTRVTNVETRRADAIPEAPETVEADFDNADEVASVYTARPVVFSEKELKALKSAGLHARDAEKIADAASKGSIASFVQGNESQIKIKQVMEMNNLQLLRPRNNKERGESVYEISTPNRVGSM